MAEILGQGGTDCCKDAEPGITPHAPVKIVLSLLLIATVYSGHRVWLLSTAHAISHDGAYYMNFTRKLESDFDRAVRRTPSQELGYPVIVSFLDRNFGDGSYDSRIWFGRLISFASGLAAIVGIWVLALQFFNSIAVATVGTLLLSVGKKFAFMGIGVFQARVEKIRLR